MASLLPLFFEVGSPSFWYLIPEPSWNSCLCLCCVSESLIKYIEMLHSLGNHWIDKVGLQTLTGREPCLLTIWSFLDHLKKGRRKDAFSLPWHSSMVGVFIKTNVSSFCVGHLSGKNLYWHMFSLGPNSIRSYLTLQSTLHNHVAAHVICRSAMWEVTSPDLFSVMIRKCWTLSLT